MGLITFPAVFFFTITFVRFSLEQFFLLLVVDNFIYLSSLVFWTIAGTDHQ